MELWSIQSVFLSVATVSCKNVSVQSPPQTTRAEGLHPGGLSPPPGPDQPCSAASLA